MTPSLHYKVRVAQKDALRFDFVSLNPTLHYEVELGREESVQVALNKAARVYVLDDKNYGRLKAKERFRYFGRSKRRNNVVIRPDHPGRWHVVINGADTEDLNASVSLIS